MSSESLPVAVVTAREPVKDNPWISQRWRVVGVVRAAHDAVAGRTQIRSGPDGEQYLWNGLQIQLRESEADSYYYNLVDVPARVILLCQTGDDGEPRPVVVTADYIDAMAHREAGADVHAVAIPPDLYVWLEQYVVAHYIPEEKQTRRKHDG